MIYMGNNAEISDVGLIHRISLNIKTVTSERNCNKKAQIEKVKTGIEKISIFCYNIKINSNLKINTKMQFKVPQDVQRRDTIIWSLTLQQMAICGIGGGIAYGVYVSLAATYFIEVWLPPVVIISAITLAFAFIKIHSLPFHEFLMNFIEYHLLPRQRYWIQGGGYPFMPPFDDSKKKVEKIKPVEHKQKKSLQELSNVLDTQGGAPKNEDHELSSEEKKKGLETLIDQNYK